MKIRGFIAAYLAGTLLLTAAGCTGKQPKMEVPETDTVIFNQMKEIRMEEWNDAQDTLATPPVIQQVQLSTGGTATLYALDTGEEPTAGTNEITSVKDEMVLNSSATVLGEHGTVLEFAESELYRWADAAEFSAVQYTQPLKISDKRYLVYLRMDNQMIGMEQYVVYTDLGDGIARIDRLWRAIPDIVADAGSEAIDRVAAYLASDETM